MAADDYLQGILNREVVDTGPNSPVRSVQARLEPLIRGWAGDLLTSLHPSGSFMKGTANNSGTDIDLFISLSHQTSNTLRELYDGVYSLMQENGYTPKRQNVSIGLRVGNYDVDLVLAKRQDEFSNDHSLYVRRVGSWRQTNVTEHISFVRNSGRQSEIRIIKLWRKQKGLDYLSFYLELTVINALSGQFGGTLSGNVWKVFHYLRDTFPVARVVDPANTNNILSDELTATEKAAIKTAAENALGAKDWGKSLDE
jgi:hypothetical protein